MKTAFIILSSFLILSTESYACKCKSHSLESLQKLSSTSSPLIILGEVISSDMSNGTYEILIIETLKGKTNSNTLKGIISSSCSLIPTKGKWIFYAETFDNNTIDISKCGLSRSFENPSQIEVMDYIPKPVNIDTEDNSVNLVDEAILIQREYIKIRLQALEDLKLEIEDLRDK